MSPIKKANLLYHGIKGLLKTKSGDPQARQQNQVHKFLRFLILRKAQGAPGARRKIKNFILSYLLKMVTIRLIIKPGSQ